MNGTARGQYTLEFKQGAVRLVRGGQATSWVAKTLGISGQTPNNWVKAEAAGRPREVAGKTVNAEQMEIARLRAELVKARMERDMLKKSGGVFCEGVAVRCAFIERHHTVWLIAAQCRALNLRHSRLDEPQGRLLGQCCDRNAVRLVEDRAAA